MIDISNLRIVETEGWTRVVVDISSDIKRVDNETTMWIGVKTNNAKMLSDASYNAFLFLPVYMGMYYHSDIHIHGNVSNKLYKNIEYMQGIIDDFSNKVSKINVIIDGYETNIDENRDGGIVGTGISCGVDCLQTIYTNYVKENDPAYKINTLFELNCGWHGKIESALTNKIFEERCAASKKVADELGLDFVEVDSNLHAFLPMLNDEASYFCIYSCIFALEYAIDKYYVSSSYSYGEVIKYGYQSRDNDFSEFGDPMLLPLVSSEYTQLISDGCQYKRSEKLELIANWDICQKYLNVCCKNDSIGNCSICHKCVRTILPLEAMGMLDKYSKIFNIPAYKKIAFKEKCRMSRLNGRVAFYTDNYQFCKQKGMKIPNRLIANMYLIFDRILTTTFLI